MLHPEDGARRLTNNLEGSPTATLFFRKGGWALRHIPKHAWKGVEDSLVHALGPQSYPSKTANCKASHCSRTTRKSTERQSCI